MADVLNVVCIYNLAGTLITNNHSAKEGKPMFLTVRLFARVVTSERGIRLCLT
jgi:hypothetical protein